MCPSKVRSVPANDSGNGAFSVLQAKSCAQDRPSNKGIAGHRARIRQASTEVHRHPATSNHQGRMAAC